MNDMERWLDHFTIHYESIDDLFQTPGWFNPHALISSIPGAHQFSENLWSTSDGFYVSTLTSVLSTTTHELIHFSEPAVMLLYVAKSAEAVLWHRHESSKLPTLVPLAEQFGGVPPLTYGDLHRRFKCFESATYRTTDGLFIDKKVETDRVTFCFRALGDDNSEHPFLIEITRPVGAGRH